MIYFSVDIETMGLCAGLHSMISLGVAAIDINTGEIVGTYKANIKELPELKPDESKPIGGLTIKAFWAKFPEAYKRATDNARDANEVIPEFVNWVNSFKQEHPVAAAWKPGFDLAFLRYYLYRFGDGDIFGRGGSGLDIKTLTAIALNQRFSDTQIAQVPKELKGSEEEHSHDALADAIEQAKVMYNARRKLGVNV